MTILDCGCELDSDFINYEAITWGHYDLEKKEYVILEETEYKYYCPQCHGEITLPIEEN